VAHQKNIFLKTFNHLSLLVMALLPWLHLLLEIWATQAASHDYYSP